MAKPITILSLVLLNFCMTAQPAPFAGGPALPDVGAVFYGFDYNHPLDTTLEYKLIFDIHESPEDPSKMNMLLNSMARFINLHSRYGVPLTKIKLVGVLHGTASKDGVTDAFYSGKTGLDNPNTSILNALNGAGVKLFQCGQSALHYGIPKQVLHPGVQLSLSAMTVLAEYQLKGYALIRF